MFAKADCILFAMVIGAVLNPCKAQSMYTVTDIGGVSIGKFSRAFGINNAGEVVGQYQTADFGVSHAFLYSNGAMTDLGTLGGASSAALAINNSGVIVGASSGNANVRAFVYKSDVGMVNITPSGYGAVALGVSDSGLVVGSYWNGNSATWGFMYQNGAFASSPTLNLNGAPGVTIPTAANASGLVAGKITDPSDPFVGQPYITNGQQYSTTIGVPRYASSRASGINAAGDVIGFVDGASAPQSFLYSNGKMTLLGSLGGVFSGGVQVYGINGQDDVVGVAYSKNSEAMGYINTPEDSLDYHVLDSYMITGSHAVIYKSGQLQDLNNLIDPNLGWELLDARSINDSGQIVGEGVINNQIHAFILTPVPEPSVRSEMLIGLVFLGAGLGWSRRRLS